MFVYAPLIRPLLAVTNSAMDLASTAFAFVAQATQPTLSTQGTQATQPAYLSFFYGLFPHNSVALTVLVVCLVGASGLALGSIKIRGFRLGIPGAMFTGLILGNMVGLTALSKPVIEFVRDFGLIIFVYAVGVQVGPGFFASLRSRGLIFNFLAVAIVLLGAIVSVVIGVLLPKIGIYGAVGLFAGGTTNAPAFASASETIKSLFAANPAQGAAYINSLTAPGFAISYPFGLLGVILSMVIIRVLFRISPAHEADLADALDRGNKVAPARMNVEIKNPNLHGITIDKVKELQGHGVVISRIMHEGILSVASPETLIQMGDIVLAVGTPNELEEFRLIAGLESKTDLFCVPGSITTREILVTHGEVLGKDIDELELSERLGVTVTRVRRGEMQFTAVGHFRLQFGDRVLAVGESHSLDAVATKLGNSIRELNHPRLIPIFFGILLGVTLGSIPVAIPGLTVPVKLGLAAGPMIIAIILARLGRVGSLIWYMPHSASQLMREGGITLFLIGVGILAGPAFFTTLYSALGLQLLLLGALVTLIPLLIVGLFARAVLKINFLHICGTLAGALTSPSLAFTSTMTASEAPAIAFATVYPLAMILRVVTGQLLVLIFAGN